MNTFELAQATSVAQARELVAEKTGSVLKAGGIDLLDHLKERLVEPPRVVDLKSIAGLDDDRGAARRRACASARWPRWPQVAAHDGRAADRIRALAQACGEAASPQIRNVATIGGNVLQRPRCWYYRLESYKCLKKGGDVCYAVGGENRYHVIFGGGPSLRGASLERGGRPGGATAPRFVLEGSQGPAHGGRGRLLHPAAARTRSARTSCSQARC